MVCCRRVHFAATVMNIIGIVEVAQTFEVQLFMQMKWGCEESEKWEPYLDWRMLACMSETVKKDEWKGGERTRHVDIRATFYQPLDLKDFPFDSHKLEVALVTDSVTDIILCKLNDSVATLHQQAVRTP